MTVHCFKIQVTVHTVGQGAHACSGAVRLKQCERRAAGERGGGGQLCFGTARDKWAKCECALSHRFYRLSVLLVYAAAKNDVFS